MTTVEKLEVVLNVSRKHYQRHRRPHFCQYSGCPRSRHGLGFSTDRDLDQHIRSKHQQQGVLFCHFSECQEKGRKFIRSDNFGVHLNRVHGIGKDEIKEIIQRSVIMWILSEPS
jgi:hypothetical protein